MKIKKADLQEQTRNKHKDLSNEEKDTKRKYGGNRCRNMSQEYKQKLKEYAKKIS